MDDVEFTTCDECGNIAEIAERFTMDSTSGPVEHVKVQCSQRHWYHRVVN